VPTPGGLGEASAEAVDRRGRLLGVNGSTVGMAATLGHPEWLGSMGHLSHQPGSMGHRSKIDRGVGTRRKVTRRPDDR
jgi:hypothetical protein